MQPRSSRHQHINFRILSTTYPTASEHHRRFILSAQQYTSRAASRDDIRSSKEKKEGQLSYFLMTSPQPTILSSLHQALGRGTLARHSDTISNLFFYLFFVDATSRLSTAWYQALHHHGVERIDDGSKQQAARNYQSSITSQESTSH